MRKYLATIHTRSDKHKKRFAFVSSAAVTLIIFGVWSAIEFKPQDIVASNNQLIPTQVAGASAALQGGLQTDPESPFEALKGGFQNIFSALKQGVDQTKTTIQSVDVNQQYQAVRNEALPVNTTPINTNGN